MKLQEKKQHFKKELTYLKIIFIMSIKKVLGKKAQLNL
jgi:hypothetical protein